MRLPSSDAHKTLLARLVIILKVLIAVILYAFSRLSSFDSSAALLLRSDWATSLLRWDVFHYAHIAKDGYVFEYEYAFFPGMPLIMHYGEKCLKLVGVTSGDGVERYVLAGSLASAVVSVGAVNTLYDLTLHHFASPSFAFLASTLSLLSSSPATLRHAPLPEPLFTYFSYKGMLFSVKRNFAAAALMFMLASAFRSNGIMLSGYIVWGMLVEPLLIDGTRISSRRIIPDLLLCSLLCLLPLLPFAFHQYSGYVAFCYNSHEPPRPWCADRLPSIYSFVQSAYWGVGLFRYWTLQQSPNILLAMPVLVLLFESSLSHIRHFLLPELWEVLSKFSRKPSNRKVDPLYSFSVTPYAVHALLLSTILLIAAHTQIALRFVSSMPFTYWAAARLFLHNPERVPKNETENVSEIVRSGSAAARSWIYWSVLWGACSLATWAVFLPPA